MSLGNYKSTPVYFNGVQVGENISSDYFPVGLHCEGMTADGVELTSMWIKGKRHDNPSSLSADITNLRYVNRYSISTNGWSTLEEWEMLLTDLLGHIKSLKK